MSVGVVIQARMGSRRLPGKVLMPLGHTCLLGYILDRLQALAPPAQLIVATSTNPVDDAVEAYCAARGVACFRGSEADVLDRYHACAAAHTLDHVVRLTADNPFVDVEELNRLIALHLTHGSDFAHSLGQLPVGVGAEVFTRHALRIAHTEGRESHHREHVDEYFLEHPERFSIVQLDVPARKTAPQLRLTVDTPADHARAQDIVARADGRLVSTEEAIAHCTHCA